MAEDDRTDGGARAAPAPVPEPMAPADAPVTAAISGRTQVFGVAASAAGHLLVGLVLVVMGSLASAPKPPQVIPVKLVPAEQAPKPPKPLPHLSRHAPVPTPPAKRKQTPAPPPKAAAAARAKHPPAAAKAPPAKAQSAGAKKKAPSLKDMIASLGMADYGHETTLPKPLLANLVTRIRRCWTVPSGWSDPRQVAVTLRFQLHPDGTLAGDPAVVEFPATSVGAAAAKAALVAMKRCAPYHLPAAQYNQWKDVQLTLTP